MKSVALDELVKRPLELMSRGGGAAPAAWVNDVGKGGSRPVSRVLSRTVIPLGRLSPGASSSLPGCDAGRIMTPLFGLAPDGVYPATHCCQACGALLPHHFTLTCGLDASSPIGGIFSVALSVGSRRPGITWRPALWSPDFPPRVSAATIQPTPAPSFTRAGPPKQALAARIGGTGLRSVTRNVPARGHRPGFARPPSSEWSGVPPVSAAVPRAECPAPFPAPGSRGCR